MTDLDRFREALDRQQNRLLAASRGSRFKPPTDLATAALSFDPANGIPTQLAEILDLSGDGMKVAIAAGPAIAIGQTCQLLLEPDIGDTFLLRGEVRWVESSAYITVFGIALFQASLTGQG